MLIPEYVQKLIIEEADLSGNIGRLKAFLSDERGIDTEQWELMRAQLSHMESYRSVLELRIRTALKNI